MRRAIPLAIPPVVLIVLVGVFIASEARLPAGWEAELDEYVEYQNSLSSGTPTVRLVARAAKPWNFTSDMSRAAFGDSIYYRTDYSYSGKKRHGGPRPLPFPPEEVWCVLLQRHRNSTDDSAGEMAYGVVFAGLHLDMYNADWVIHEGAWGVFTAQLMENLSMIGCDLGLEQ